MEARVPPGADLTEELPGALSLSRRALYQEVGLTSETIVTQPVAANLQEKLLQRFKVYYKVAIGSHDRRPIRRPEGEIPKDLLESGNAVLVRMLEDLPPSNGKRFITSLNASVYATARAIAVTADELRRDRTTVDPKRRLKELYEQRRSQLRVVSILSSELRRRKALRQRKEEAMRERKRPWPSWNYLRVAEAHKIRRRGELGRVSRKSRLSTAALPLGDTLSPLLFCLAIAWIQAHVKPYQTKTGSGPRSDGALQVNHVFYMDDLKVFTPDWESLMVARKGIQRVAGRLGLEMNMSKCAIRSLNSEDMGRDRADEVGGIPILGGTEVYKYLGAEQTGLICFEDLWHRVAERRRLRHEGCSSVS
ncbi:hypothetical protein COOONC_17105 [Cooperia oncophora]